MRSASRPILILTAALLATACGTPVDRDASSDGNGRRDSEANDTNVTNDVTTDGGSDTGSQDSGSSDVIPMDVIAPDATPLDATDDAASDATTAVDAIDAIGATDVADASDAGATGACTTDAMCTGGAVCLVGHCYRVTDTTLPLASVPSPDRCRVRIGVDHPSGAPFRVLSVVANSTGDIGYESVLDAGAWTRTMLSSNVSRYDTPRFRRAPSGALENSFIQGTTVYMGASGGAVMQSGLSDYAAEYSPTGELVVATKYAGSGMFSTPYPVRLWRRASGTWGGDLVTSNISTDGIGELHFRSDGTPDVLAFQTTRLTIYRKALDVWNGTLVYTATGTHAGGEVTIPDPAGGSHVIFGTRVFTIDASVGELTVVYLHLASDGTITRTETLPVGGHGFTLRDATIDIHGNLYVMITAPASGGRYPTHVVRVSPTDVTSSVIANFESTTSVCSLAVAPDATMYLAAYTGFMDPLLLRTYAP